ncbi:HU family DNA-binding protein [Streptomyces sp. NPDC052042]|uniref:HU family DNA-binding protein n=1 Tax=Streptomyces sp. NPDC052042 TaxID=3365683 RepID=UPI0037D2DDBB
METAEHSRVSKREFISRVAVRSGLPVKVVGAVYTALFSELRCAVGDGETVVLTGFGRFYRQAHKGHKVRFGKQDVGDYPVLKFSASRSVNRRLEKEGGTGGNPEPERDREREAVS